MIIANTSIVRISFIIMHGHASYFFKVIRSRLTTSYSNTIREKMTWYFGDLGLNVRLVSFVVTILAALLILYTPFGSRFLAPAPTVVNNPTHYSDCCWTGPWEMHTLLQFLFTLCIFYLNKIYYRVRPKTEEKKPHSQLIVWKICIPSWGKSLPYNHNS